jgi:hypothetical protein
MKKNCLLVSARILVMILFLSALSSVYAFKAPPREFYQLTVYHFGNASQEKILDNYLQHALIPSLHRLKIGQIGVFKPWTNDTAANKQVYVLIPITSVEMVTKIPARLQTDKVYQTSASEYINALYNDPPYTRMETILLQSFELAPKMQLPALKSDKKNRVYELRSYESASEKIYKNKVQMFNQGDEIGLFKRLNFNAVFYGEVIAGSKMPNLMYMTSFENMDDRNKHWKAFVDDPYWKKLSAMPEYQNNVSHMDIILMYPAEYSDY